MMAQDFQDITGQIIKKVVNITQKLERELAQLLVDTAPLTHKGKDKEKDKEKVVDLLAGPAVPASAMAQNDVDDLLADLGF
jgi:chemotaxis protein CheZ